MNSRLYRLRTEPPKLNQQDEILKQQKAKLSDLKNELQKLREKYSEMEIFQQTSEKAYQIELQNLTTTLQNLEIEKKALIEEVEQEEKNKIEIQVQEIEKKATNPIAEFFRKQQEIIDYLSVDGLRIREFSKPDIKYQLAAVNQNGEALQYIENAPIEVELEAVKQTPLAYQYIQKPTPALLMAFKNHQNKQAVEQEEHTQNRGLKR